MPAAPLMSVLLPVYNGMPFLPQAVDSILSQSFQNWELLIVDNGSTDETPEYLKSLNDPRVRLFRLEKPGFADALNFGLQQARAPWIARMDADDAAMPERLEHQYRFIHSNPDVVLFGCHFDVINRENQTTGEWRYPVAEDAIRWQLLFGSAFGHPGTVFRLDLARSLNGYRKEFFPAEDYELWTRFARFGRLANIPEKLLRYREHPVNATTTHKPRLAELGSGIGAAYAQSLLSEIDPDQFQDLSRFMFGAAAVDTSLSRLTALVDLLSTHPDLVPVVPSAELQALIQQYRTRLRHRCLELPPRFFLKPFEIWSRLRAAGRFDPNGGRLRDVVARKWRKLLRRG